MITNSRFLKPKKRLTEEFNLLIQQFTEQNEQYFTPDTVAATAEQGFCQKCNKGVTLPHACKSGLTINKPHEGV